MDVLLRIQKIMQQRGLSNYVLSEMTGISRSTLSNHKKRKTTPTIATLIKMCDAMDISLSQFFADENTQFYPVDDKLREVLDMYLFLDDEKRSAVLSMMRAIQPETKIGEITNTDLILQSNAYSKNTQKPEQLVKNPPKPAVTMNDEAKPHQTDNTDQKPEID